jgi:hypothetical protein
VSVVLKILRFLLALALLTGLAPAIVGEAPECGERDLRRWLVSAKGAAGESVDRKRTPYPKEYYIALVEDEEVRVEYLDSSRTGLVLPFVLAEFFDYTFDKACLAACREEGPACWWKCGYAQPGDGGAFTINSRGFVRTDYEFIHLARLGDKTSEFKKTGPFSVYHVLRPYCGLKDGTHCRGDGILLRKWGDSFYQIAPVHLIEDRSGEIFVSPFVFDREGRNEIEDLIVPLDIAFTGDDTGCCCWKSGNFKVREYRDMKNSPFAKPDSKAKDPDDYICVTHGIPVSRMQEALTRP